jgi:hypothetical protein
MTLLLLLADAAAAGNSADMNYITTGAIAAVCSLISGVVLYSKGRQKREVSLTDQPVGVKLADQYVTRQEFAEFRGELKADVREMRMSYDKLLTLIDERDRKLTESIQAVASGAYEGRRRLHDTVNLHSKQLASIETKADIGKGLTTLGKAIMSRNCLRERTTNPNPTNGSQPT